MAGKRLDSIQGYRFLLFLAVYLFHGISNWFSIGWGGGNGVPRFIFFLPYNQAL